MQGWHVTPNANATVAVTQKATPNIGSDFIII